MTEGLPEESYGEEIQYLEYWLFLLRNKFLIAAFVGIALAASLFYSTRLPKTYTATATIFPPLQTGMGENSDVGGSEAELVGLSTKANLWVQLLMSKTLKEKMIKRFSGNNPFTGELKGQEEFGNTKNTTTFQSYDIGAIYGVRVYRSPEDIISITVSHKDPAAAARIANAFIEELDATIRYYVSTSGKRMRVFIESRLEETREKLYKAEETLRAFEEENGGGPQSSAVIGVISGIKSMIMSKEIELETLLSYATTNNPEADFLRTQIRDLKKRLIELEQGRDDEAVELDAGVGFIPKGKIPELSLQYKRLKRNVNLYESRYNLLLQQYEVAQIQEAKDSPAVQVLDEASAGRGGWTTYPKKSKVVMSSVGASLFLALLTAYIKERRQKSALKE